MGKSVSMASLAVVQGFKCFIWLLLITATAAVQDTADGTSGQHWNCISSNQDTLGSSKTTLYNPEQDFSSSQVPASHETSSAAVTDTLLSGSSPAVSLHKAPGTDGSTSQPDTSAPNMSKSSFADNSVYTSMGLGLVVWTREREIIQVSQAPHAFDSVVWLGSTHNGIVPVRNISERISERQRDVSEREDDLTPFINRGATILSAIAGQCGANSKFWDFSDISQAGYTSAYSKVRYNEMHASLYPFFDSVQVPRDYIFDQFLTSLVRDDQHDFYSALLTHHVVARPTLRFQ